MLVHVGNCPSTCGTIEATAVSSRKFHAPTFDSQIPCRST